MKPALLLCLLVCGCIESPAAPNVGAITDLTPAFAPQTPMAPGPCPQIREVQVQPKPDSIYFYVRLTNGALIAKHGETWCVQIEMGQGDLTPGEVYVHGKEEKEGRVPIRFHLGGSADVVGHGTQRVFDGSTVVFAVPRAVVGANLSDQALILAFGLPDECVTWTLASIEAGNPRWQPVRHSN